MRWSYGSRRQLALPHIQTAGETDAFWRRFSDVADDVRPTGNLVRDAHLLPPYVITDARLNLAFTDDDVDETIAAAASVLRKVVQ